MGIISAGTDPLPTCDAPSITDTSAADPLRAFAAAWALPAEAVPIVGAPGLFATPVPEMVSEWGPVPSFEVMIHVALTETEVVGVNVTVSGIEVFADITVLTAKDDVAVIPFPRLGGLDPVMAKGTPPRFSTLNVRDAL